MLVFVTAVAPKRAPWDYKGRMEDMEQYLGTLKSTQQESIQRIEMLESQKHQLQGNVVMKEKEMEEVCILKDLAFLKCITAFLC